MTRFLRYRALLLAGLAVQSLVVGCKQTPRQTMSDLWEARWSGARVDLPTDPKKTEPSVTANVAATTDAAKTDPTVRGELKQLPEATRANASTSEPTGVQTLSGSKAPVDPSFTPETDLATASAVQLTANESLEPATPQTVFAEPSLDQIERLKAALNDDAERAKLPAPHANGAPDVRVRVESMVARARSLFDLGKLREARHAAKTAHDLGDSARLDYSPDEERPIDLIQRIDDQLREAAEPIEAGSPQTAGATDDRSEPKASASPTTPTGNVAQRDPHAPKGPERDPGARPKRDWSLNVFRRDRKTAPVDPVTAQTSPEALATNAASSRMQLTLETDAASPQESDGAMVQANRCLTLVKAQQSPAGLERQARDSSTPIAYAPFQRPARAAESSDGLLATMTGNQESAQPPLEFESIRTVWPAEVADSPPRIIVDETTPPPADLEEVKPISPFRDVAGHRPQTILLPEGIDDAPRTNWNWLIGIALFGTCAVVAIFWYRRGAI